MHLQCTVQGKVVPVQQALEFPVRLQRSAGLQRDEPNTMAHQYQSASLSRLSCAAEFEGEQREANAGTATAKTWGS